MRQFDVRKKQRRKWVATRHASSDRCDYCGNRTELPPKKRTFSHTSDALYATCDHRTPLSKGGCDDYENFALACHICNGLKDSMTEAQFRAFLKKHGLHGTIAERRKK